MHLLFKPSSLWYFVIADRAKTRCRQEDSDTVKMSRKEISYLVRALLNYLRESIKKTPLWVVLCERCQRHEC